MSSVSSSVGTTLQLQYVGNDSAQRNLPYPLDVQLRPYTRSQTGFGKGVLFVEQFLHPMSRYFNDGAGVAFRDMDIPFDNRPSCRLDPQSSTIGLTTPGRTANQSGVVAKVRLANLVGTAIPTSVSGIYGNEQWIRWTSNNNGPGTNVMTTVTTYNRDGTNLWIGRLWIDTTFDPMQLKILQNGGNWLQIGTYNSSVAAGTHQIETGIVDRAGLWNYVKLIIDFYNKVYVSAQFNELYFPFGTGTALGVQAIDTGPDTGARTMHFSTEYAQQSLLSTSRYINVGQVVGTVE